MIDIIIPAYNAHDTISDTLFSIAMQDFVKEVNVVIVNDASDKDYSDEIKYFSRWLKIKEIKLDKNMGPGYARNIGLKNTTNPYVMFIDSDDTLYDVFAIKYLYFNILFKECDVVVSSFLEETPKKIIDRYKDDVWLHGKLYKRSFLDMFNINFNDSRANEDSGFNMLVKLCGANINYVDGITYIWRCNLNSITRFNDYEYIVSGLEGYTYNVMWAINEAIQRIGLNDDIKKGAYEALISMYFQYCYTNSNNIIEYSKELYLFNKNNKLNDSTNKKIYNDLFKIYNKDVIKKVKDSNINFDEFINKIEGAL